MSRLPILPLLLMAACALNESALFSTDPSETGEPATPRDTDTHSEGDVAPQHDTGAPPVAPTVTPSVVSPPFETAVFDAGEAAVEIAEYRWSLISQPEGSTTRLVGTNGPTSELTPDLAGDYEVQLVVEDTEGTTYQPATVWLTSTPGQALWIEMYWTEPDDDMDLHLLAPGGELETNSDCYYMNCVGGGPDWGVVGDTSDDPALDLDDIPGVGPENINIDQPQDGDFEVWVHDYTGSTPDYQGENLVTVKVYLDSLLAWSDKRGIEGENSYNHYCTVSMAAGTVTGM